MTTVTKSTTLTAPAIAPATSLARVNLAALAAVLHVAVFAGTLSVDAGVPSERSGWIWRISDEQGASPAGRKTIARSNPHYHFAAGRLDLRHGVAILALACWLVILRIAGSVS
jgi:hypothetical protein